MGSLLSKARASASRRDFTARRQAERLAQQEAELAELRAFKAKATPLLLEHRQLVATLIERRQTDGLPLGDVFTVLGWTP